MSALFDQQFHAVAVNYVFFETMLFTLLLANICTIYLQLRNFGVGIHFMRVSWCNHKYSQKNTLDQLCTKTLSIFCLLERGYTSFLEVKWPLLDQLQGLSPLCPEFAFRCVNKVSYAYHCRFSSCTVVAFVLLIDNELTAATPLNCTCN